MINNNYILKNSTFNNYNKSHYKYEYLSLIIFYILVNSFIIFDIYIFRQLFAFLFFSVIPGLLIVNIFVSSNKIDIAERILLSVGLSISMLIIGGLILNYFYPFLPKPLSLAPVLIAFNAWIAILIYISFKKRISIYKPSHLCNIINSLKGNNTFVLLMPILFPIISILGTHIMNKNSNNILILSLYFLIAFYIIFLTFFNLKIHYLTYPIAIYMISISLLLSHSLTSYHITGRDINIEYFIFSLTSANFHWDASQYYHPYNSCLSITILPTIYWQLMDINKEYIFKLVYPLVGAFSPLCIYYITLNYFKGIYSFYAALLFIFQKGFIYTFQSATRQEIAIFFFALSIMVFFNKRLNGPLRKAIAIIFTISVILSHYTTSYLYLFVILSESIIASSIIFLKSNIFFKDYKYFGFITPFFSLSFICFAFLWFSQITEVPFNYFSDYLFRTLTNMESIFSEETHDISTMKMLGEGISSIPNYISIITYYIIILIIAVGILRVALDCIRRLNNIPDEYAICALVSFMILSSLFLPYVSTGYGAARVFAQYLVFLAPLFIAGATTIQNRINKKRLLGIIAIVLVIQFFSVTSLIYHFYGIPTSPDYETSGEARDEYYIFDQELAATRWLKKFSNDDFTIYSDRNGYSRILLGFEGIPLMNDDLFLKNKSINEGYIYLGYANVVKKTVRREYFRLARSSNSWDFEETKSIDLYSDLFTFKGLIYQNQGSEVYIYE